jgi:WD40 repeat protein/predicted phosphodiesterase
VHLRDPEYREAFERDLRRLHDLSGPWDLVFISGGLTQTGGSRDFDVLNSTLESLWEYFRSLGSQPCLLAVPGDQDFLQSHLPRGMDSPLSAARASDIRKALRGSGPGNLSQLIRGSLRSFTDWFADWRGRHPLPGTLSEGLLPGDFAATLQLDGAKIGVAGFNSLFRSAFRSNPKSTVEIDAEQLTAAVGEEPLAWARQHDFLLLLTHSSPAAMNRKPLARIQEKLSPPGRPFLHLCGSQHKKTWTSGLEHPRWPCAIQAPSLFGVGRTEGPQSTWGYAAAQVSLTSAGGRLRYLPRTASLIKGSLTLGPDRQQLRGEDALVVDLDALSEAPPTRPERADTALEDSQVAPRLQTRVQTVDPAMLESGVRNQSTLDTRSQQIEALAWSLDGDALAIGLQTGVLVYWRPGEETPRWSVQAHLTGLTDLCFAPDGQSLATRSRTHVRAWRTDGTRIQTPTLLGAHGTAFACSSTGLLAVHSAPGRIDFLDTRTWRPLNSRPLVSFVDDAEPLPTAVHCFSWSSNGEMVASGGEGNPSLAVWRASAAGTAVYLHREFAIQLKDAVLHLDWMPDSPRLAMATRAGAIHILDLSMGKTVATLEWHTDAVSSVAFSSDGRLLASRSIDGKLGLWRTDTWALVGWIMETTSTSGRSYGRIAFSPKGHTLATPGPGGVNIRLWELDIAALLQTLAPPVTIQELSAKVVLVGEGRAGKSCLALRMVQDRYEEMESTHGMQFWSMPSLPSTEASASSPRQEVILWDMGGQSEYQLVHQLFLRDSAAALMVMEPGRGERAMEEIEGWNQRLLAQTGPWSSRKLLVGTKLDSELCPADPQAIEALMKRCQFVSYVETSAKTGQGIPELKAALSQAIDWDSIEKVSRPELFQRIRRHLQRLREERRVVLTFSALEAELRREMGGTFDPEALRAVVGQLSRQGLVADTRMADGTKVLILEIEQVERYAGSLIIAARDNPHGVPAIDVAKVMSPSMRLPRIPAGERLRRDQELQVLDCVIELLLEHGLCLRHEGLLIFPSLFRPTQSEAGGADFSHPISLLYDFSGAIDNIYASLIASLAISRRFGPMRLWQDRAEFGRAGEDSSGVRRVKQGSQSVRGHARLEVYFDANTPKGTRELFVNLIEEHLREQGVELLERLTITCTCGRVFAEDIVRERLNGGHMDIGCPVCDRRTPLTLGAQQARERNPELTKQLQALRTDIQAQRTQSITETKVVITEATKAKPPREVPLRILHLSDLHVGAADDPISLFQPLVADLQDRTEGLGVERLDYLVISGDITNIAAPQEFEKAREFVSALIDQFGLTAERCIIVPGNHDLDWDTEVYTRKKKRQVDTSTLVAGTYKEDGDGYYIRDEAKYPERFKNFSQHFYHPLTQKTYPLAQEEQCLPSLFSESRLQFLAMNSAWEIDEYHQERASISERALSRGLAAAEHQLAQARRRGELAADAEVLRLCVWHHPLTGNEKIYDDAFAGRLLQAQVRVCLHGHVHENRPDVVRAHHTGQQLHIIGAGSFGAPTHHRPESVPRLYNLLEVARDLRQLRVRTRSRPKQGGAWEGWAAWKGDEPHERRTYYDVALP